MSIAIASLVLSSGIFGQPSLAVEGAFSVSEGGSGMARGSVELVEGQINGGLRITFSRGEIESLQFSRITFFQAVPQLAFLEGTGIAKIRQFGHLTQLRGKVFIYVDDLGFNNPNLPDQLFIRFDAPNGAIYVRHGQLTSGDIAVVPE